MLPLKVSVRNEASRFLEVRSKSTNRAVSYALGSTGKWLRNEMKTQGKMATKGGYLRWPSLNPYTTTINKAGGGKKKIRNTYGRQRIRYGGRTRVNGELVYEKPNQAPDREPLSRLINAIRSEVNEPNASVRIGFLKQSLWDMMTRVATGREVTISDRMRRMLYGIGVGGIGSLSKLKMPARPLVGPVYEEKKVEIPYYFKTKMLRKMAELG